MRYLGESRNGSMDVNAQSYCNGWQYMPASNRPIAGGSGCPSSWLNWAGRTMPIVVADLAFPPFTALRQCYRLKALSWPQRLLIEFL